MNPNEIYNIADEIRLAVAPVFLLTALAALLNLTTQRLTRLLDRLRVQAVGEDGAPNEIATAVLRRRLRVIQWSIRGGISAAILICFVVIAIFMTDTLLGDLAIVITTLFTGAMLLVVFSLALLLVDIGFSVSSAEEDIWE